MAIGEKSFQQEVDLSLDDEHMVIGKKSFQTGHHLVITEEELAVTDDQEQMSTGFVLPATHDKVISAWVRGRTFSRI